MSSECHETATVTRMLPENRVEVVVKRSEACGSCSAKGACQALGGQTKDLVLTLENSSAAKPGDMVRISISESAVVKASAILYLLPALGLLGFALLGNELAPLLHLGSDAAAVLGALCGLCLGFALSWLVAKRVEKNRHSIPVITRVIHFDSDKSSR
ncbi:MAG: SoxR reducing system RseC family protein [Deltaproteobacteria bacterium]|nr:SoxR reducing system RseC family protein [Deltaproteobacteria bacterium]